MRNDQGRMRCAGFLPWEETEPDGVDEGVNDGVRHQGAGFHPGAAVEQAGDGRQQDVFPVGHGSMENVREAENDGCGDPPGAAAFERARKQILQQAAKQEFLGPCGEDENFGADERRGAQAVQRGAEADEVHGFADGNDDERGEEEIDDDGEAEAAAPFDGVADAVEAANDEKGRERRGEREKDGERVRELVREGKQAVHPAKLHRQPDDEERGVVLPDAGGFSAGACGEERGKNGIEDSGGDVQPARGIELERVDEKSAEREKRREEKGVSAEPGDNAVARGRAGSENFGREEDCGDADGDGEARALVAEVQTGENSEERNRRPDEQGSGERHLARARKCRHGNGSLIQERFAESGKTLALCAAVGDAFCSAARRETAHLLH